MRGRVEVLFAGFGGQGIILAGLIAGKAVALYDGKESVHTQSYGPEARGGACSSGVVIDETQVDYPYASSPDILVIMSQEAYDKYLPTIKDQGILIVDEDLVRLDGRAEMLSVKGGEIYRVPATRLAESLGNKIVANIIMLGFFVGITGVVSYEAMKKSVLESVPKRFVKLNEKAYDTGFKHGESAKKGSG